MPTLAFQLPDAVFHFGQCLTQPVTLRLQTAKIQAGLAWAGWTLDALEFDDVLRPISGRTMPCARARLISSFDSVVS